MKQYKHKIIEDTIATKSYNSDIYYVEDINGKYTIPKWLIENSNDWEEIKQKDYEILSFKQNSGIVDLWIRDKTTIQEKWSRCGQYTTPYSTQEILNNPNYNIHSIKRLSDGEIFTIGDKIQSFNYISKYTIKNFELDRDKIFIYTNEELIEKYEGSCIAFKHIEHIKQPLFITEDGVEIFEIDDNTDGKGKRLYQVALCESEDSWNDPIKPWDLCVLNNHKYRGNGKNFLVFSTQEKAQEYIDLHKPKYSLSDVEQAFFKASVNYSVKALQEELRKLNK